MIKKSDAKQIGIAITIGCDLFTMAEKIDLLKRGIHGCEAVVTGRYAPDELD